MKPNYFIVVACTYLGDAPDVETRRIYAPSLDAARSEADRWVASKEFIASLLCDDEHPDDYSDLRDLSPDQVCERFDIKIGPVQVYPVEFLSEEEDHLKAATGTEKGRYFAAPDGAFGEP